MQLQVALVKRLEFERLVQVRRLRIRDLLIEFGQHLLHIGIVLFAFAINIVSLPCTWQLQKAGGELCVGLYGYIHSRVFIQLHHSSLHCVKLVIVISALQALRIRTGGLRLEWLLLCIVVPLHSRLFAS